jgi:hypothetical protein
MRVIKPLFFAIAFALLASACLAARAADKVDPALDAAPAGLVPSAARLSDILAKHEATISSHASATIVEDWSYTDTGLAGTEHLVRSGTDYHSTLHSAAEDDEYGQFKGKRWHRGANGYTTPSSIDEGSSFAPVRVTEDAVDPKNDVSLAGQTTGAHPAYVVKVSVSGAKHPEWIFYDAQTSNIVRIEYVYRKHRLTTTYDDFRTVKGVTQPWHIHDSYWEPELDDDWHVTAFDAGMPIAASEFAMPSNPVPTGVAERATIPSKFVDEDVVLRVNIGGRGLDFELDPTVRYSFIDFNVAQSLGLPTYGQNTQTGKGDKIGYETRIADAKVGPIELHDFPVWATDVSYEPDENTKIVGVLGYDFLSQNIIRIDYVHQMVEALPMSQFAGTALPIPHALDIPFQLDDGTPLVPMDIGDGFTDRVVFNTSMPWTVVFGPYMDQHASSFADLSHGHHAKHAVPFADNGASYGQSVDMWLSQTPVLAFANLNFTDLPVLSTSFGYTEPQADAMLGDDYLRYYDIYFDYPHDRLLLVPNDWFNAITKKPKAS